MSVIKQKTKIFNTILPSFAIGLCLIFLLTCLSSATEVRIISPHSRSPTEHSYVICGCCNDLMTVETTDYPANGDTFWYKIEYTEYVRNIYPSRPAVARTSIWAVSHEKGEADRGQNYREELSIPKWSGEFDVVIHQGYPNGEVVARKTFFVDRDPPEAIQIHARTPSHQKGIRAISTNSPVSMYLEATDRANDCGGTTANTDTEWGPSCPRLDPQDPLANAPCTLKSVWWIEESGSDLVWQAVSDDNSINNWDLESGMYYVKAKAVDCCGQESNETWTLLTVDNNGPEPGEGKGIEPHSTASAINGMIKGDALDKLENQNKTIKAYQLDLSTLKKQ